MKTYHLFIDKEYCIRHVFGNLQMTLEPGIKYIQTEEHSILPPYIRIESIYRDEYFKGKITEQLRNMGYDKSFTILKPLVKEVSMLEEEP